MAHRTFACLPCILVVTVLLACGVAAEFPGADTADDTTPVHTVTPAHTVTPVPAGQPASSHPRPANVSHWLYLIDVNLDMDMVERMVDSEYDMVVLDFIPSEKENTDYPMGEVVARLHAASHPKLVMAYIDIGEAEEYRTYWEPGWRVGDPEWIAGEDPDGWEGNFPVAYWHDEWRQIWLGEGGYLAAILDAGFDGIYLDWIEAYSDESVIAIAEDDGVDPQQEMIWWIQDMAEFCRGRRPGFFVIGQNGAELAEGDDYLAIIDAIAQEQVWFDGGADNDPLGDCPLPRTEAEVDTGADVGVDGGAGGDVGVGDIHFPLFSPIVIACFITAFGGGGIIGLKLFPFMVVLSVPVALGSGIIVGLLVGLIVKKLYASLQSNAVTRVKDLIGTLAEVSEGIPAAGVGEITFTGEGSRLSGPARSEENKDIKRHAMVTITRVVGGLYYVREHVDEKLRDIPAQPEKPEA